MRVTLPPTLVTWLTAVATPAAPAQESKRPSVIALKAARLFDGKSDALQASGSGRTDGVRVIAVATENIRGSDQVAGRSAPAGLTEWPAAFSPVRSPRHLRLGGPCDYP
jgi:hypothetical protein